MTTQILTTRISADERETHVHIFGNTAIMDSTIPRDFNKALRQNWIPISKTIYPDGTICGMVLTAPRKSVTIRNAMPVHREMSEEHKNKIAAALASYRKSLK